MDAIVVLSTFTMIWAVLDRSWIEFNTKRTALLEAGVQLELKADCLVVGSGYYALAVRSIQSCEFNQSMKSGSQDTPRRPLEPD